MCPAPNTFIIIDGEEGKGRMEGGVSLHRQNANLLTHKTLNILYFKVLE